MLKGSSEMEYLPEQGKNEQNISLVKDLRHSKSL